MSRDYTNRNIIPCDVCVDAIHLHNNSLTARAISTRTLRHYTIHTRIVLHLPRVIPLVPFSSLSLVRFTSAYIYIWKSGGNTRQTRSQTYPQDWRKLAREFSGLCYIDRKRIENFLWNSSAIAPVSLEYSNDISCRYRIISSFL